MEPLESAGAGAKAGASAQGAGAPAAGLGAEGVLRQAEELRPYLSAGRVVMAFMMVLAVWGAERSQPWVYWLVGMFLVVNLRNLWREATGRGGRSRVWHFWFATAMLVAGVRGTEGAHFIILMMGTPLIFICMLHGVRQGALLAAAGAASLVVTLNPPGIDPQYLLQAGGILLLPLGLTVLARPMAALRQRVQLQGELDRGLDPRRGLQAIGMVVAERLRAVTDAQRVVLCHRDAEAPTVLVSDADEASYAASPALAHPVLALLDQLPVQAMALHKRTGAGSGVMEADAGVDRARTEPVLRELATLLDAQRLQIVPDRPGNPRSGWLLVACGTPTSGTRAGWSLRGLAAFAEGMRRLLQQASYVDSLQAEIAAHERARLGRDLHDSALQPYLGLKFAIDALAQSCTPADRLNDPVQELRRVCETELTELRETVSALRTGAGQGENTLTPALRRQADRFTGLFGIHTHLDIAERVPTSRALSAAVLHMFNEALNNVRRHTRARNVWVSLKCEAGMLHLVVRDDAARHDGQSPPPFEPRSLAERAHELGGTLQVRRHQGLDTEIHIAVPV